MGVRLREHVNRRAFERQLWQTYIIALAGVWIVVLLWYWVFCPIFAPGVWPLLDLASATTGHKAPTMERDLFVSVTARGELFLNEQPVQERILQKAFARKEVGRDGRQQSRKIFVRVDRSAPFSAVRPVVRAAQAANVLHVVFLARPSTNGVTLDSEP